MSNKVLSGMKKFYDTQYKKLLIIPIFLLILAVSQIIYQATTTGDFIHRGVDLKGGITVSVPEHTGDIIQLENSLKEEFQDVDINVRAVTVAGTQAGIVIDADIDAEDKTTTERFLNDIEGMLDIEKDEYSVDVTGSSLGRSFFRETITAMIVAFIFMGIVVFLYFKTFVPSMAVILAALSDIIVTVAIFNVTGMKLGTGGIAALLMLIGYSVDTDILLSTRVLKRTEGTVFERVLGAMNTGLTMNLTTIAAILAALFFTQSEVIKQIMMILIIGLLVDIINTWLQNVGILRLYMEKRDKHE